MKKNENLLINHGVFHEFPVKERTLLPSWTHLALG